MQPRRAAVPLGRYLRATRKWFFALRGLAPHPVRNLAAADSACRAAAGGSAAHGCNNDREGVCASARVCTACRAERADLPIGP